MSYNLSENEARVMKFGECMQQRITKNLLGAKFWIFDFFKFYWILFVFLRKKITKITIKREKSKIQNTIFQPTLNHCKKFDDIKLKNFEDMKLQSQCIFWNTRYALSCPQLKFYTQDWPSPAFLRFLEPPQLAKLKISTNPQLKMGRGYQL